MNQITVLVADDQSIYPGWAARITETNPDIQVVAEARNGMEAYEQTEIHHPQVVLMDIPYAGNVVSGGYTPDQTDFPGNGCFGVNHI